MKSIFVADMGFRILFVYRDIYRNNYAVNVKFIFTIPILELYTFAALKTFRIYINQNLLESILSGE